MFNPRSFMKSEGYHASKPIRNYTTISSPKSETQIHIFTFKGSFKTGHSVKNTLSFQSPLFIQSYNTQSSLSVHHDNLLSRTYTLQNFKSLLKFSWMVEHSYLFVKLIVYLYPILLAHSTQRYCLHTPVKFVL